MLAFLFPLVTLLCNWSIHTTQSNPGVFVPALTTDTCRKTLKNHIKKKIISSWIMLKIWLNFIQTSNLLTNWYDVNASPLEGALN